MSQQKRQEVLRFYLNMSERTLEMGAEEPADSLDEKEVAIVMEIAEAIDKGRKDKLPAPRNLRKKKFLEETAKVDKVLCKFKTHSVT